MEKKENGKKDKIELEGKVIEVLKLSLIHI